MEDNKELYSSMPLLLYYEDIDEDTDGVIERNYPTDTAQIKLVSYQYSADRMGGAPVITASFYNDGCIDSDMWSKRVYTKFRRERYYLKNIPSSTKDNTNVLTKHDVTFISERFVLDNILFYDVIDSDVSDDNDVSDGKYVSNSTTFNFFGSIEELAARLNAAFAYANVDYVIEIDKNLPKIEDKLVTADNAYLSSIIQEFYNTFEIPYYFVDKTIHVGYYEDTVGIDDKNTVFEYGASNALLSITKTTSDTKVITRCTGIGSEENIHYFYPNPTELGTVSFDDENVEIVDVSRFNSLEDGDVFEYVVTQKDSKEPYVVKMVQPKEQTINGKTYSYLNILFQGKNEELNVRCERKDKRNPYSFKLYRLVGTPNTSDENKLAVLKEEALLCEAKDVRDNGLVFSAKTDADHFYKLEVSATHSGGLTIGTSFYEKGEIGISPVNNDIKEFCEVYLYYNTSTKNAGWYLDRQSFNEPRYCQLSHYGLKYNGVLPEEAGSKLQFKLIVDKVLPFQTNLMPSIFRASDAKERFYNADNGTYEKEDGTTYIFDTPYNDYNRKEHLEKFEDIKPTIVGMTNGDGQPIDEFKEFAYDDDDNDKLVAGTEDYEHPYFYAKLRKLDGPFGFNLFDQASEKGEMTISMTSGNCGACNFVVIVDDSKRNPVQVNDDGTLKKDAKGNVIVVGTPQDRQNDTRTNEVWVALKKDTGTYGVIMPNATHDYKPKVEDKFVIVNIALPQAYIEHAEKKLEDEIIKFMWENNGQAFDFSIKFSRIYLAENTALLKTLTENAMIKIGYPNKDTVWDLYVSNFVYKVDANSPLPEITLSVTKKLGAGSNSIQTAISKIERNITERLNAMPTNEQNRALYMSKDGSETVDGAKTFSKKVTFENGAEFGEYTIGEQGASIHKDDQGQWVQEIDYLNVRKKLTYAQIEVLHAQHLGGAQITSAASCYIDLVENKYDESGKLICYRCYFKKVGDEGIVIKNLWEIGDQAYSEKFDSYKVTSSDNTSRMAWWRKVILTSNDIDNIGDGYVTDGEETINAQDYHFIDVSALNDSENCAEGIYEYTPSKGDSVILLGNRNQKADPSRTNAIVQSSSGDGSPYYKQFKGIVDFVLPEPQTLLSPEKNVLSGIVNIQNGSGGAQYLTDLPETVLGTVKVGGENLLLNTSFKGNYRGTELYDYHQMNNDQQMFSDNFVNWDGMVLNIEVDESITANNICSFFELSQDVTLVANETYTLTFKMLGLINVQYGASKEIGTNVGAGRTWTNEKITFVGTGLLEKLSFVSIRGGSFICDIKLEKGNIPTDWTPSSKDENAAYEEIYANKYINRAIREGKTSILGGLILTSLINLGKYEDGNLTEITSGISGIYNDDHDVAFWGGGDLRKAIKSVQMYRDNPKFVPTEDELEQMAKTIITHGGRAILNDVIARGTIYAEDGVFRGSVRGKEGIFKGGIRGEMLEITQDNFKDYLYKNYPNRIDFDKAGYNIRFVGEFNLPQITIALPTLNSTHDGKALTKEEKDEIRCSTGNRILIYNDTGDGSFGFTPIYIMYETFENGYLIPKTDIIETYNIISIQSNVAAVNGVEYIYYDIKKAFVNNL